MKIALHDNGLHLRFAPLTLSRPVGDLRMGILTNKERWEKLLPDAQVGFITEDYLYPKFGKIEQPDWIVDAALIPSKAFIEFAQTLKDGEQVIYEGKWLMQRGESIHTTRLYEDELLILQHRWDLYTENHRVLASDFDLLTSGRMSQLLSETNRVIGDPSMIFLEDGARVEAAILNTTDGPIYVGADAEIMEGSMVRGPLAICAHAGVKMGAKIYGATTIGPHCKVGGEISNCLFQAYSNKGHDGFLGNSVLGEWCNLGADTNSSNLKNNYSKVSAYSYETRAIEKTGVQFMGVMMGDHSKSGINTMFNTATVIGFSANIYGGGFPDKVINSFSWGGPEGIVRFKVDKAIEVAKAMMGRRKVPFTEGDQAIFDYLGDK